MLGEWLKLGLKVTLVVPAIGIIFTVVFGGLVTTMDFTLPGTDTEVQLQDALVHAANIIATVINVMPWMEAVFNVIVAGIAIKFFIIMFEVMWKVISLFMSS